MLSAVGGLSTAPGVEDDGEGGSSSSVCLLDGSGCDNGQEGSLDDVISAIRSVPRNDDVLAQLSLDAEDSKEGGSGTAPVTAKVRQKLTVVGSRSIAVTVR